MTTMTLSIICVSVSLVVMAMLIHYVAKARASTDMLCFFGLLAAQLGLLQSGRAAEGASNMFYVAAPAFALFCVALGIWRMGFERLRGAA